MSKAQGYVTPGRFRAAVSTRDKWAEKAFAARGYGMSGGRTNADDLDRAFVYGSRAANADYRVKSLQAKRAPVEDRKQVKRLVKQYAGQSLSKAQQSFLKARGVNVRAGYVVR